jgi:hypothetical protein
MITPGEVKIEGYQLCGVCGNEMYTGEQALLLADVYAHETCTYGETKRIYPKEWKRVWRSEDALDQPDGYKSAYACEPMTLYGHTLPAMKLWSKNIEDAEMLPVQGVGWDASQFSENNPDEKEDTNTEPIEPTGARWNGRVYNDCRDFLTEMAIKCDRPRVARLMEQIAYAQVMRGERSHLYREITKPDLEADDKKLMPFVDTADDRTGVGLDYVDGQLVDKLPDEVEDYTEYTTGDEK